MGDFLEKTLQKNIFLQGFLLLNRFINVSKNKKVRGKYNVRG